MKVCVTPSAMLSTRMESASAKPKAPRDPAYGAHEAATTAAANRAIIWCLMAFSGPDLAHASSDDAGEQSPGLVDERYCYAQHADDTRAARVPQRHACARATRCGRCAQHRSQAAVPLHLSPAPWPR